MQKQMSEMTQAELLIETFGGAPRLAKLIGLNKGSVYRWCKGPDHGGSNGLVPSYLWPRIMKAAAQEGIDLNCDHFVPFDNDAAAKAAEHNKETQDENTE